MEPKTDTVEPKKADESLLSVKPTRTDPLTDRLDPKETVSEVESLPELVKGPWILHELPTLRDPADEQEDPTSMLPCREALEPIRISPAELIRPETIEDPKTDKPELLIAEPDTDNAEPRMTGSLADSEDKDAREPEERDSPVQ